MAKRSYPISKTKLGYFSKDATEYTITEPNLARPWFNSMANKNYSLMISHTGGGFSIDNLSLPLNTYDEAYDQPGKWVYLRNDETGKFWSTTWQPVAAKYQSYVCRHGFNYSIFENKTDGIESSLRVMVPVEDRCEVWTVQIKNTTKKTARISAFPFMSFKVAYGVFADDNHSWFSKAFFKKNQNAIEVSCNNRFKINDEFIGYFATSAKIKGFETSNLKFLGQYYEKYAAPKGIKDGRLSGTLAECEQCLGVFHHQFKIEPGETVRFDLVAGFQATKDMQRKLIRKYKNPVNVDKAFDDNTKHWQNILSMSEIKTPDAVLDRTINTVLKRQVVTSAVRSRTKSLRFGYRDILQDLRGIVGIDPDYAKLRFLEALQYQYADGRALRQWSRTGDDHDFRDYCDLPLWITYTLTAYIRETGDTSVLDEKVKFFDSDKKATVYEHALRGLDICWKRRAKDGLCLIFNGDISDAFDMVGLKGKGRSILQTECLYYMLKDMKALCVFIGDAKTEKVCALRMAELKKAINGPGWDKEWFLRCINDYDELLGSHKNKEGRIQLLSQAWAIMGGSATPQHAEKAMRSVEKYLKNSRGYGNLTPPYRTKSDRIGDFTVLAGHQNGTNYVHHVCFMIGALIKHNQPEKAVDTVKRISPSDVRPVGNGNNGEPYAFANDYMHEKDPRPNEAWVSWATGGTSWIHWTITEWLMGVNPDYKGLRIEPIIPKKWKTCSMRKVFRNAVYEITIKNSQKGPGKLKSLTVDGKKIAGNILPDFRDGNVHKVIAVI